MSTAALKARNLMEQVLRDGRSMTDEYPTVFGGAATGAIVTVEDDGDLRAACAVQPRILVVGRMRLSVGLIGSVVTDPAHQSRGFGTRLLESAEGRLRDAGCAIAMLWADEEGFYARRGYHEIGSERDFIVTPESALALPMAEHVRAARAEDGARIHALYEQHDRRVERTEDETRELLRGPGMTVLVSERSGQVDAYACLGRGRDLPNVIHEWGGDADGVLQLVRAHVELRTARGIDDELYLIAPGARGEVQGRLALAGVPSAVGVLGMGKLLDSESLARSCAHAIGASVRVIEHDAVEFRGPRGLCVLTSDQLLDLAVPAHGEGGAAKELGLALGLDTRELPLNPFVWGLDSI